MTSDLKIEIFAYKWFYSVLEENTAFLPEYDVTEVYKDEWLVFPDIMEASNCEDIYHAIVFRRVLFEKLYFYEIDAHVNEFRNSQMDFYHYIIRTCNRVDLFGSLSIFEQVLATSAFVACLYTYNCWQFETTDVMKCGYICWTMYFEEFLDGFYKQGGWTSLKVAAASYRRPMEFLTITSIHEDARVIPTKIRKATKDYYRFKETGEKNYDESISISWAKYCAQNRSSDNDFDYFIEESSLSELKNYSKVEDLIKQLKYLCDPNGSEIVKTLNQISSTDSLETSMADLNIGNKYENLQSDADGILEPKLKQTTTFEKLASKSTENRNTEDEDVLACNETGKSSPPLLDISSEQNSCIKIGRVSDTDLANTESIQLQSQEQGTETTTIENLLENLTVSNSEGKNDLKKNTISTAQLSSTGKNMVKEDDGITFDSRKEQKEWETKNSTNKSSTLAGQTYATENDAKIDNNKILIGLKKQRGEEEIIKGANRSMNLIEQIPLTKKNAAKENDNITQDGTRKELEENSKKAQDSTRQELEENFYKTEVGTKKEQDENNNKIQNIAKKELEENNNKIQDNTRKELEEFKGIGEVSFLTNVANAEEENTKIKGNKRQKKKNKKNCKRRKEEITVPMGEMINNEMKENKEIINSLKEEQEDGDIKNLLRLFLVLGDKQGNSYVRKSSQFDN